jgi:hypothetical protein
MFSLARLVRTFVDTSGHAVSKAFDAKAFAWLANEPTAIFARLPEQPDTV